MFQERTFEPEQGLKTQKELDAVGSRPIALQTIMPYKDLPVTLVECKSVEEIQNGAG